MILSVVVYVSAMTAQQDEGKMQDADVVVDRKNSYTASVILRNLHVSVGMLGMRTPSRTVLAGPRRSLQFPSDGGVASGRRPHCTRLSSTLSTPTTTTLYSVQEVCFIAGYTLSVATTHGHSSINFGVHLVFAQAKR